MRFTTDKRLSMHSDFRFGQIRTNKNTKHSKKNLKIKLIQNVSKEMGTLSKKEIWAELKKLGINTTTQLKSYLKEYYNYIFTQKYLK
jgi:hypothetical protein